MIDNETKTAYFFVLKDERRFMVSNSYGETEVRPIDNFSHVNTIPQSRSDFHKELKEHCTFHENPERDKLLTTENLWGMPKFKTWHEIPGYLTWDK